MQRANLARPGAGTFAVGLAVAAFAATGCGSSVSAGAHDPVSDVIGRAGDGEILPNTGRADALLWIPDWIGNGGAVSGGGNPGGRPATVTVACRGAAAPAEARVVFTPQTSGTAAPTSFTVACPAGGTATGTATVPPEQAGNYGVSVRTTDQDAHWGLAVVQPES
ncbi:MULTISPECIES: hypothetical protein [Kitasatospora]|uniref:Lipoprotein n=1 Tax=Kitasatospora setae (strain ATCC 33774 / DSM 43861 / JCM 3304 / KCC A-0304 / NBRC 14216 / KM-6054) TaxID=452652 RepID=E4N767_KITSK|nr:MULTISPECIES: hypothetical protein [Kitasatospora]BAJ27048.1 hypothetical protein KSE_12150 [Kitasatospora setae KM-6054]